MTEILKNKKPNIINSNHNIYCKLKIEKLGRVKFLCLTIFILFFF